MGKKKMYILISVVLVLAVVTIVFIRNRPKNMCSYISIGCSAEKYYQGKGIGYITLKVDDKKNIVKEFKVNDKNLQKQLSEKNLNDVIGANMIMTIPKKETKKLHIDFKQTNMFDLLYNSNVCDKYIDVVGISFKKGK